MNKRYQDELEALTGKVYSGDLTPVVYDLLADSPHLSSLYTHLTGEKIHNDNDNNTHKALREKSSDRPCFEKWFRNCERL